MPRLKRSPTIRIASRRHGARLGSKHTSILDLENAHHLLHHVRARPQTSHRSNSRQTI
ncbi:hypothetical protein EMEDMD4_1060036 [Sinorhizobium medicae]|uniref:Uncharacterized protein n=1 Tax=Sinorhizobium medicae TaxID=110321 RepID=A0A508WPJ6_9HYPH|nr:hypothetical protein EMEDMD4_1060036 [Sinorhizobium medicae]